MDSTFPAGKGSCHSGWIMSVPGAWDDIPLVVICPGWCPSPVQVWHNCRTDMYLRLGCIQVPALHKFSSSASMWFFHSEFFQKFDRHLNSQTLGSFGTYPSLFVLLTSVGFRVFYFYFWRILQHVYLACPQTFVVCPIPNNINGSQSCYSVHLLCFACIRVTSPMHIVKIENFNSFLHA